MFLVFFQNWIFSIQNTATSRYTAQRFSDSLRNTISFSTLSSVQEQHITVVNCNVSLQKLLRLSYSNEKAPSRVESMDTKHSMVENIINILSPQTFFLRFNINLTINAYLLLGIWNLKDTINYGR